MIDEAQSLLNSDLIGKLGCRVSSRIDQYRRFGHGDFSGEAVGKEASKQSFAFMFGFSSCFRQKRIFFYSRDS